MNNNENGNGNDIEGVNGIVNIETGDENEKENENSISSLIFFENFSSHKINSKLENRSLLDFLSLQHDSSIKNAAIEAVKECGVGTCGPCGFYGTQISHIELESCISKTLNMDASIVYSQGFSSISSVIPAFSKKGDVIVADELINTAIYKGMMISRSRLYYYKHNDIDDLKRVLEEVEKHDKQFRKPLTRRFIISEGVFQKGGDLSPLPKLIQIKTKYRYRLILDESLALGTIGKRGLGSADYWNCQNRNVDILVGVLGMALGSSGGFCAGSTAIVEHQRLSSQAYCFSASLPVLFAKAAMASLSKLTDHGEELMEKLHGNLESFKLHFKGNDRFKIPFMDTPYMLLQCNENSSNSSSLSLQNGKDEQDGKQLEKKPQYPKNQQNDEKYKLLYQIIKEMSHYGYQLMMLPTIDSEEKIMATPSIRICLNIEQTEDKVIKFAQTLEKIINFVK